MSKQTNKHLSIHRVTHLTISVSDFKSDKSKENRHKILRWFEDKDYFNDYSLCVEEEFGGKYVLWAVARPVLIHAKCLGNELNTVVQGRDSLDQNVVNRIQVAPVSDKTQDCDFVIFSDW
jgi:hypothetical protein